MERFVYLFYRAITKSIALLPLQTSFRLGEWAGWGSSFLLRPYWRLALRNLEIAYGGEKSASELRKIAREHFTMLGGNLLSSVKVATLSPEEIHNVVEVDNPDFFRQMAVERRGVVLVISHMGNWEILAQICPLLFPGKGGTIYQRLGNRFIDADIRAARARQGLSLFERKEGFQGAIALVRDGGGVGILIDQHAGDKGIWSPLFDRLASTTPLAATIALRTGAALIPAGLYTVGKGKWRLRFTDPIDTTQGDASLLTAEINQKLESLIRISPADWFWVHNRWKLPNPNFLLSDYKRGVTYPKAYSMEKLKPFRILVRSSNWLGDAVMTLPAVQAIKKGRPDAHVTVLVRGKLAEFWHRVPEVDEVIAIDAKESVFSVAAKIRGRFEVAVVLPNSPRTALEVWLAGIPRRVGVPGKWRERLLNQLILPPKRKATTAAKPARHQVFHYLSIAERLGADIGEVEKHGPQGFFCSRALTATPLASGAKLRIGICPGAEFGGAKRWLPERFAETMQAIAAHRDCEWVFFGVAGDAPVGEAILSALGISDDPASFHGTVTNLIGKTTLSELIDAVASCRVLLTNDTGTMHLAAALAVPTVAIFGSTEPQLTGPLGPHHHVIRHQVECSPCFQRECPLDFRCMEAATSREAAEALLKYLV